MRKSGIYLCAAVLLLASIALAQAEKKDQLNWPTYRGAWFSIQYPPEFKVSPSIQSPTSDTGYDSVFFISPDNNAVFYVFCPKEKGDPQDIAMDREREVEIDHKLFRTKKGFDYSITIVSRPSKAAVKSRGRIKKRAAGGYTRLISGNQDPSGNITRTFAITYRDGKSYSKYKRDYSKFRASLVQVHK